MIWFHKRSVYQKKAKKTDVLGLEVLQSGDKKKKEPSDLNEETNYIQ